MSLRWFSAFAGMALACALSPSLRAMSEPPPPRDGDSPPPVTVGPLAAPKPWAAEADRLLSGDRPDEALEVCLDADREPGARAKMESIAALLRAQSDSLKASDWKTLEPLLEKAATRGVVSAQMLLAEHLRTSDPETSLHWFEAAAARGQTEAMTQAGLMISNGLGVSAPDLPRAVEWFEKAAAAGDTDAMTALAECLIRGKGVEKDPKRAAALLEAATAFQHPMAFNLLGDLYVRGLGVPRNYDEALRLFERGTKLGSGDAMANLGVLHLRGWGVPADPERAVAIWKSGAAKGYPACMWNYGRALSSGTGVKRNEVAAREWFAAAARGGNSQAAAWCRSHDIDF